MRVYLYKRKARSVKDFFATEKKKIGPFHQSQKEKKKIRGR
jgi:hypothetical protein